MDDALMHYFSQAPHDNSAVHNPYEPQRDPREIIEDLRVSRGYRSNRALAIAAGVQQTTLSRYMAGETKDMEMANFRAIADALEVTVSQLLGETPIFSDPRMNTVLRVMERLPDVGRDAIVATANALCKSMGDPP
jgi:transcriptional regulator with XRE-family HTH domain